jgi:fatty acid amide hydrolase
MTSYSRLDINRIFNNRNVLSAIIGIFSIFSIQVLIKMIRRKRYLTELEKKRKTAISDRDLKIEKFIFEHKNKVSLDKQEKILTSSLTNLVYMIKTKKVSCQEVLVTYALRAGTIGRDLNLIADVDFDNAYKHAVECDRQVSEGRELGALHGVPFSLYEQISVKGMLTTCGYSSYVNNINNKDSLIISILRKEGAIPFLKSNIPQGFMSLETSNNLWGQAKNPWNEIKTPGGSNGGEAGLLATRSSAFGIGSDLFGSIRIPCAFTGVYGFKPTSHRNSKIGATLYTGTGFSSILHLTSSYGPICKSMDDILLLSKTLFGKFEDDVYVNNKPFNDESYSRVIDNNNSPMKIGYIFEVKDLPTVPGIKLAMEDVIHKLKTAGFILHEFPIQKFEEFIKLGRLLLANSDVIENIKNELKGEEMIEYYNYFYKIHNYSSLTRCLVGSFCKLIGNYREANFIQNYNKIDLKEFLDSTKRYLELKSGFINYWKEHKFDAIISPVFPTPALDHQTMHKFINYNHMSYIYNMADLPAVTVPIILNTDLNYKDNFDDDLTMTIKTSLTNSTNLPIAIQVGTLPNQDELALRLAKDIDYFYRFDETCAPELMKKYPVSLD